MISEDTACTVKLALHTFSYEQHFLRKPGFDAHRFLARASERAMAGVHISLNGYQFRCAGGTDPERLEEIGADARERGFFVECDTSGTDPDHLAQLARAARQLGADRLRTYTRHTGSSDLVRDATVADLKAAAPRIADEGICLLLENHEDFTGQEVCDILDSVAHPAVAALYDFGNSMNVAEEPMDAAKAMAKHIRSVHLKDHAVIISEDGASMIAGVPNGSGTIAIADILEFLIDEVGLERVCIESSYGYCSTATRNQKQFEAASRTSPTFKRSSAPFDRTTVLLDADALYRHDPDALFDLEEAAVARGVAHTRQVLEKFGFQPHRNGRGGVYHRNRHELALARRHG
jgi:sugar phosphate isomerase/epimerase